MSRRPNEFEPEPWMHHGKTVYVKEFVQDKAVIVELDEGGVQESWADAREDAQWRVESGVAHRTVHASPWVLANPEEDNRG